MKTERSRYSIEDSDGYNAITRLNYLINGLNVAYFNNRIELSKDADERASQLKSYGFIEGEKYGADLKLIYRGRGYEGQWIRRAPHSYGWDIMPRAVTSGLWREVCIEERDDLAYSQLFLAPMRGRHYFIYELSYEDRSMDGVELEVCGECKDSRFSVRKAINRPKGYFYFNIEDEQRWMPYGYGVLNLYEGFARIYRHGELIEVALEIENSQMSCKKISYHNLILDLLVVGNDRKNCK